MMSFMGILKKKNLVDSYSCFLKDLQYAEESESEEISELKDSGQSEMKVVAYAHTVDCDRKETVETETMETKDCPEFKDQVTEATVESEEISEMKDSGQSEMKVVAYAHTVDCDRKETVETETMETKDCPEFKDQVTEATVESEEISEMKDSGQSEMKVVAYAHTVDCDRKETVETETMETKNCPEFKDQVTEATVESEEISEMKDSGQSEMKVVAYAHTVDCDRKETVETETMETKDCPEFKDQVTEDTVESEEISEMKDSGQSEMKVVAYAHTVDCDRKETVETETMETKDCPEFKDQVTEDTVESEEISEMKDSGQSEMKVVAYAHTVDCDRKETVETETMETKDCPEFKDQVTEDTDCSEVEGMYEDEIYYASKLTEDAVIDDPPVTAVTDSEDSDTDFSDIIPAIGQHLKSEPSDTVYLNEPDDTIDSDLLEDDSDDEYFACSYKNAEPFALKESQIERDVNYPDIYIRKHMKSRASVSGQSYKKKNDRVYNNYHCCFVCSKMVQHIPVHIRIHRRHHLVQEEMSKNKPNFTALRIMGDDHNNRLVIQSKKGEFIVARRKSGNLDVSMYGPCFVCRQWMMLSALKKHYRLKCGTKKSRSSSKSLVLKARILAGHITEEASDLMKNEVFKSMKQDQIGRIAQKDKLILALGESWLRRSMDNVAKRRYYTSEHMRLCARLYLAMNEIVGERDRASDQETIEYTMSDMLLPQNFDLIVKAALKCSLPSMDDFNDLKSPSNAIKLKYDIRRLENAKYAYLLKEDDPSKTELKQCKRFLKLMDMEWSERVTKVARTVLQKRQLEVKKELPAPADVEKITKYLTDRLTEVDLEPENFKEIVKLCQVRLLVYNKRRSGELEVVSLQNYAARKKDLSDVDESIAEDLTVVEKQLLKTQELMTVRGKGGRPVPVIIPLDAVTPLAYIASVKVRESAGVVGNKYLFPNSADGYMRVYQTMQSICSRLQLKAPGRITSVALRKYTATLSQMMNLDKYQLDWVCKHLGHTKSVHREAYRQMSGLVERVYITKLMLVQDNNLSGKYKTADLTKMNIEDLVFPEQMGMELDEPADVVEETNDDDMEAEDIEFVKKMDSEDEEDNFTDEEEVVVRKEQRPGKKAAKHTRQVWSKVETEEIERYFESFLKCKVCPRKNDVERAKKKSFESNGQIWKRSTDKIVKKVSAMNHKKN